MLHRASRTILVLLGFSLVLLGCDSSSESAAGTGGSAGTGGVGGAGGAPRLVVTADWLNQSLTLFDYDKLIDGQSDASQAIVDTIDLSDWEPGPIELEITPDGKTAVVSVGPAFFDSLSGLLGDPEIPPGGTLLIVDLETGTADEIQTEDVPLGIAISPDGRRAYTANYGTADARGDTLSVIDIPGRQLIADVQVGSGPEQVALSPDGTLGIVNVVSGGGIRIFQTSDVAGTLSEVLETGSDPSDVSFLDGNDRAVVANSFGFDVTLVDTSNPSSPSVIESVPVGVGRSLRCHLLCGAKPDPRADQCDRARSAHSIGHFHRERRILVGRSTAPAFRWELPPDCGDRFRVRLRVRRPHRRPQALDHRPREQCCAGD